MKEEIERKIHDAIIGALAKPLPSRPSDDDIKRAVRTVFDAYEVEVIPSEIVAAFDPVAGMIHVTISDTPKP